MNPRHSIIIPHRGRDAYLHQCLRSIDASRSTTGIDDWELLIVGQDQTHRVFNKARALNEGISQARGHVLTFLDCDALVGPRWFESVAHETFTDVDRLCYRVKRVTLEDSNDLLEHGIWYRDALLDDWDRLHTAYEQHRLWEPLPAGLTLAPLGNSQFSISREALGGVRFDESYEGYGYEDLDFVLRLYRAHGGSMRDRIIDDKAHALMHLSHPYNAQTWRTRDLHRRNKARFLQRCRKESHGRQESRLCPA